MRRERPEGATWVSSLNFGSTCTAITSISFILAMSLNLQVGGCGLVNFGQVVFLDGRRLCDGDRLAHGRGAR